MLSQRVVVTGLGMMTGQGLDLESSWRGIREGQNATRRFSLFDPKDLLCWYGVELPPGAEDLFARHIIQRSRSQMTRGTMIALICAHQAIADADLLGASLDRARIGVVVGGTGTGYVPPASGHDDHRILRNMQNSPAGWISLKEKFSGPSFVVSTACSSGAFALACAHWLIVSGQCDAVVAGAADSAINYDDVRGFSSLMALAEEQGDPAGASRPFDRKRNGFVIGEGGGMLVLESPAWARKRRARIYAEMPAPGLYSEAYNIISPQPGGGGMVAAMERALTQAGIGPEAVAYINAHGTSTPLNDLYEGQAIKKLFGPTGRVPPVSSTKSVTGHCLAAAAGIEAVVACLALRDQVLPPTANLSEPDPELDLDFIADGPRPADLRCVMSNSFAFGGHNGVNIFFKPDLQSGVDG